jgi:hypothetical protein
MAPVLIVILGIGAMVCITLGRSRKDRFTAGMAGAGACLAGAGAVGVLGAIAEQKPPQLIVGCACMAFGGAVLVWRALTGRLKRPGPPGENHRQSGG